MKAGSITFSTALDNEQLEKDLQSLTKKIEKKEREIAELTEKRDQAKEKGLFDMGTLDAEKAKLQEIKDQLTDLRNMSKDKAYSPETREGYAAQIPAVKQEYEDQKTRVNALQKEWNQTESAVERYTSELAEAEAELHRQQDAAGGIVQELDKAKKASGGMGNILEQTEKRLSDVLEKLRQQQSVATEVNAALGDVANTQMRLIGLAEELTIGAKIGLAELARMSIHGLNAGLSNILNNAKQIPSLLKKVPPILNTALSKGMKLLGEFGKDLFKVIKNMNVFSKLSKSLGGAFKRLGSTIKQALVFSVIYKGLSTVREQMGSYLMVNTQFSTSLRQLQGVLLTAFQPIYDVVVPALTTLINAISRAIATVSQFTASLFGTTAKQAQKNAEALHKEANALKETGSAAEEAAGSLAGFDEINTIQTENKSGGGGGASEEAVGPAFDYEYAETAFDSWGEAFNAFLDNLLTSGIPRLESAFSDFADWLNSFSKKLYDMLTFPGVLEKVQQLGTDLANALNSLVDRINWYQLGQALGAGMNLALQFLVNLIYAFDWINLGMSLAELVNGAVSEIDWYAVGMLLWAGFKIAIETLAGFLLGLDMVALAEAASNLVKGFFNSMKETLEKIDWEEIGEQIKTFLVKVDWLGIAKAASGAISQALSSSSDFFTGLLGEELKTQIRDLLETISKATLVLGIILILTGVSVPLGLGLLKIGALALAAEAALDWEYMSQNIQKILGEILSIAGAALLALGIILCFTGIALPLGIALIAAGAVGLVSAAALNWNAILEKIQEMVRNIKNWWDQNVAKYLTLEYWKGLGKDVIDGFMNGLKSAWDGLTSWFSGVWDDLFGNRKVSVDINRSGNFGSGGSGSFGGSRISASAIPPLPASKIPALARGAVIPPNREFLAVLGDQRNGTNLEAPEGLIRQLFQEETGRGNAEILQLLQAILNAIKDGHVIMVGETVLGRTTIRAINNITISSGKQMLKI